MSRRFTKKDWPKKPARLDDNSWWACVVSVESSTGVREDEVSWACEVIGNSAFDYPEKIVRIAADAWYRETDQCGEAALVIRVENFLGNVWDLRVLLRPVIKSEVERCVRVDGDSNGRGTRAAGAEDSNGRGVPPPPPPAEEKGEV